MAVARYEIPNRFRIARYVNGPAENRGGHKGSRHSRLTQDEAGQVGGLLEPTASVPVTPSLGSLPSHIAELWTKLLVDF